MSSHQRLRRCLISIRLGFGGTAAVATLILLINGVAARGKQSTSTQQTVELGFVLPRAQPGAEISGSLVADPDSLKDVPGLIVVTVPVTADQDKSNGSVSVAASLIGHVYVDTGDGNRQRADGPIVLKLAADVSHIAIKIFSSTDAKQPMAQTEVPVGHAPLTAIPQRYTTPPAYAPKSLQVLHGPTGGDSRNMRIETDGQPCTVVAAKPGTVFFKSSENIGAGEHTVTYREGTSGAAFAVSTILLSISAGQLNLRKGQSTNLDLTVSLSGSTGSGWKPGLPPSELVDMNVLRRDYPELSETPPQGTGELAIVLRNVTPHVVRTQNMPSGTRMWHLPKAALPLHYRDVLTALVTGTFNVQVIAVLYAAEIEGQPFLPQHSERTDAPIPVRNDRTKDWSL